MASFMIMWTDIHEFKRHGMLLKDMLHRYIHIHLN